MLTIRDILQGCEVGRIQTVGTMQIIPLLLEEALQDDRFETPDTVHVGTSHYGKMDFTNPSSKPLLLPSHVGYVVKQAAQDHAMATAGIVPAKKGASWDNAMCIQQSQGGYIRAGTHKMLILPLALRRPALEKRGQRNSYSKLWRDISSYNQTYGMRAVGELIHYIQGYERQMDQFIAEFECVDNQVGAIVLINGNVVGVERAPSHKYWQAVWEPLLRVCYGSAAIAASKQRQSTETVLKTRVPLEVVDLSDMDSLCDALEETERKQDELVKRQVRALLDDGFQQATEQRVTTHDTRAEIRTLKNSQFVGQVAMDITGGGVLYASLVVADGWSDARGWDLSKRFEI